MWARRKGRHGRGRVRHRGRLRADGVGPYIGPTIFHRLIFLALSPQTIIMLVTAHCMYHTLKVGHRHIAFHALTSRRFGPCIDIMTNTASAYRSQYAHVFPEVTPSNSLIDFD